MVEISSPGAPVSADRLLNHSSRRTSLRAVSLRGLLGPALAVVLGMWIVAGAQIGRTRKLLGASWGRIMPWGDLLRMTALAAALGLALAWARLQVQGPPIVVLGVGCLFYMMAFYALGLGLGIVGRAELAEARNLLHRIGGQRR